MNSIDDPRLARAALSWLVEPGNRWVADRIIDIGLIPTAEGCLRDTEGRYPLRAPVHQISPHQRWDQIRRLWDTLDEHDIRMVCPADRQWPGWIDRLTDLPEKVTFGLAPPVCLWVRGTRRVVEALCTGITVTGTKAATAYGIHMASEIAQDLAFVGRTVITNGGFGIDTAGLRSALLANGVAVVIASRGLDRPYPAANARLLAAVAEKGLVVSAYPPGQLAYRQRFTMTNVLLAVLSHAVVVVEAGLRSSCLISLGVCGALRQPALVVPGPVTSAMSAGCHQALREHRHCRLVTCGTEVLAEMTG